MRVGEAVYPASLTPELIAPCGMNCGLCRAHLRARKPCDGCNGADADKPPHCVTCSIKTCAELDRTAGFCFECSRYPCRRLRQLDARYRSKYGMSMTANLERIREIGLDGFVVLERARWACSGCGGVVCVHNDACLYCGRARDLDSAGRPSVAGS
jgi:Protein of unknown function (DUF3795)